MNRNLAILALPALLVAASAAHAQEPRRGWGLGLGPRYSYVMFQGSDETAHQFGLFARARSTYLGLEGVLDYRSEDLPLDSEIKSWPVQASVLVYPLPVVYALAGVGWYHTTLDFPGGFPVEDQTTTKTGYHFGGGVEIPVARSVSLTSDVRWQFIDYDFEDIPESVGDVDSDQITVNAGLAIGLP